MGAQALEILRQGLWASLSGGWFYDPHQSIFCNTFHFYLWIALLSFPFSIYLYFPPSFLVCIFYCSTIALLFFILKVVNVTLHRLFDTAVCFQESIPAEELPESQKKKAIALHLNRTILEEEGIELQELKSSERPANGSLHDPTDDDSLNSVETAGAARAVSSTIDLKVDVHRKNSSGSSEEARALAEYGVERVEKDEEPLYANVSPQEQPGTPRLIDEVKLRRLGHLKCACLGQGEKSDSGNPYDMGITANGSCGVLPRGPPNAEQLKNTGSLELPLGDYVNIPASEKGLLYWKHHIETSCCDNLRKAENVRLMPSEASLPSTSSTFLPAAESAVDLNAGEEMTKEEEEAKKFLEEEFEWFQGEYSDRLPVDRSKQARIPKFNSDDNILDEKIRCNQTMPCLKFQVNSDEDSSDNAGSRSPLLCRHDSLEKPRAFSVSQQSEAKSAKSCPSVGKSSKPPLTVYQETAKSTPDNISSWMSGRRNSTKRESYLGNKKLSLPSKVAAAVSIEGDERDRLTADDLRVNPYRTAQVKREEVDRESFEHSEGHRLQRADTEPETRKLTRERRTDVMTWSTERVGFDWLFEHTDSETDCTSGVPHEVPPSSVKPPSPVPSTSMSLGAIPKTVVSKRNHRHRPVRSKRHSTHVQKQECEARRGVKRQKNERENGIIDEEDCEGNLVLRDKACEEYKTSEKSLEWRENRETYDSSSGSATELSSLLPLSSLLSSLHPPSSPLLAAFLASRRELPTPAQMPAIDDGISEGKTPLGESRYEAPPRTEVRARHQRTKRSRRRNFLSGLSKTELRALSHVSRAKFPLPPNAHIATSFNDTTQGAVHSFEDDNGIRWNYFFDPEGILAPVGPILPEPPTRGGLTHPPRFRLPDADSSVNLVSNSNSENESSMSVSPRMPRVLIAARRSSSNTAHTASTHSSSGLLSRGDSNNNANQLIMSLALRRSLNIADAEQDEIPRHPIFNLLQQRPPVTKNYYKLFYSPWHHIKIRFDRLQLIALLDRNLTPVENWLSFFLSVLVSICGILLLSFGFYRDLYAFLLCVTIAGCHYSLLKSVQPDAASPTHGFNRVVIYSRAVYFCLISATIIGLTLWLDNSSLPPLLIYNVNITSRPLLLLVRDLLCTLLLFFPLLFTLGLFPQVNTFCLYVLEQSDIHIFGGNAASSLTAAVFSILRSIITVLLIFGFAYGAFCEKKQSQHILFSIFATLVVTWSYHLSRSTSDPTMLWNIIKDELTEKTQGEDLTQETGKSDEFQDPLPAKLKQTVHDRLINDAIVCCFVASLVIGIHCSSVFTTLQPDLNKILWIISGCSGLVLHYIIPQLRKQLPWLCLARPVLRSHEHGKFEVLEAAKIMWFEEMVVILCFLERNVLYPVLVLSILTSDAPRISEKFGPVTGALIVTVCGVKVMRASFSQTANQYLIVGFSALLLQVDYHSISETFLIDYFFLSILFAKTYELLLKIQFVITYIAPWQITWGSAFHAFAQPFSVPHSAILFVQAAISSLISAPLNPFLGSAIFLTSYVRPVKFWERDYNTKRVDQSNTRLSSHLERNLGSDDNNLNSIFYEHLTRSLQHSLCGDLLMGRWGPVSQGDCFVLASDYLNCLVHIIEMGNGLVTFQMRGLEFRGTYCQQREVEAISEGVEENDGCCCCEPGHLPNVLSVNAAFSQRWLAWEVMATKYVLEGYSISDNSAASMLQVFDFRKLLVTYYIKGIIWYCIRSPRLQEWLSTPAILSAMQGVSDRCFVDLDPVFNIHIDQDFDCRAEGITRSSFCNVYHDWIAFCAGKLEKNIDKTRESPLVSLCLALSLLGRRALCSASYNTVSGVEFFLHGLHALFKGDFRITSIRDEWVFTDMDLLKRVVAPAVRLSLKLHQDHFMSPDEYEENSALYSAMEEHDANLVISHEGDPAWRSAVLSGTPSLLALRHVLDDGTDEYKVIMLNKRFLSFRVIKLNRECVRGLWAGQQQELVFLRNRNPERGSIQNAKQALRNIINSSCDQPIGYPIYVSPLTTSYADTNEQLSSIIGGPVSLQAMRDCVLRLWKRIRHHCRQGCSSGNASRDDQNVSYFGNEGVYAMTQVTSQSVRDGYGNSTSGSQSMDSSQMQLGTSNRGGSLGRSSLNGRGSFPTTGKISSSTLASLAGLLTSTELAKGEGFLRERETSFTSIRERQSREDYSRCREERKLDERRERPDRFEERRDRERTERSEDRKYDECRRGKDIEDGPELQRVRIVDPKQVFDAINLGRRIDVLWPDEIMRFRGGRSYWKNWLPDTGMEGVVVHKWVPNHRDPNRRSHVDKTILLMRIAERYVPIAECGVEPVYEEETSPQD